MTTATLTRSLGLAPIIDRAAQAWAAFRAAREANRAIAQTCRELGGLTDRELADLGIMRIDIPRIAREAVLGR